LTSETLGNDPIVYFQGWDSHPSRRFEDNKLGIVCHSLSGTYFTILKHTAHWVKPQKPRRRT
jgi:hypothetical protein